MARKHLLKQHGKEDAEADVILAECFPEINSTEENVSVLPILKIK